MCQEKTNGERPDNDASLFVASVLRSQYEYYSKHWSIVAPGM